MANLEELLEGEFGKLINAYKDDIYIELGKAAVGHSSDLGTALWNLANASAMYGALRSEDWIRNYSHMKKIKAKLDKDKK